MRAKTRAPETVLAGGVVMPQPVPPGPARHHRVPVPVRILQLYVILLFVFPSYAAFKPLGAAAFPAGIVGMLAFALWVTWTALGSHNPLHARTPIRIALGGIWVTSLLSYIALQYRPAPPAEVLGADRWLLLLAAMTGVATLASECVNSLEHLKRIIRTLLWAASFCAVVALLQYFFSYDLAQVLGRSLPGFTVNDKVGGIEFRSGLSRVTGTTVHPIELGTTMAMLLPLAIFMVIHDKGVSVRRRVVPAVLIFVCIPMSVSRSAVVGVAASLAIVLVVLPVRQRVVGLACIPVALTAVFLTMRGILSTLTSYFAFAGADPSISTRTDDYPLVLQFMRQRPWFGRGGGTYLPANLLEILDNQYLMWIIEFGVLGLLTWVVFFICVPAATAFYGRRRVESRELRLLLGTLGAAVVSGALTSVTFDSFSFPDFACVYTLMVGFIGATWRLAGIRPRRFGLEVA